MRVGRRRDRNRRVQQLEDALNGGHGRLERRVLGAEFPDGHEEFLHVFDERDQRTERDQPAADLTRAVPQHERDADGAHGLDQGEQAGFVDVRQVVGVAVVAVAAVELGEHLGFLREDLNHEHAGQRFLQKRVDARQPFADRPVRGARAHAEEIQQEQQQGQQRQRHQRQLEVDRQHDADDPGQGQDVHEDGQRARGERLVDGVHVGRQPGDQPAGRRALEEAGRQRVQMGEQVAPQVRQTALRDQHGGLELHVEKQELAEQRRGEQQPEPGQSRGVALFDVPVHGELQQVGLRQHAGRRERQADQRQQKCGAVGPNVPPQAAQQRHVVGSLRGGAVESPPQRAAHRSTGSSPLGTRASRPHPKSIRLIVRPALPPGSAPGTTPRTGRRDRPDRRASRTRPRGRRPAPR